ncbi:uncharacterized protein [Parasteatoda tepidariorum]|uniref:uncharacterized protein n=1 Tax=Parasteatoda tepidariorum TaxID=114398 RepID=UPI0039BD3CB9
MLSVLQAENIVSESMEEALGELLKAHFPVSHPVENEHFYNNPTTTSSKNDWEAAKMVLSYEKVVWTIKSFKPYNSPAMDDIMPIRLIKGVDSLTSILCRIFRACIACGYIPHSCWNARIIFIPKKVRKIEDKSFRPISLTSCLLKAIEKFIDRYFRHSALIDKPLSSSQHAYQSGKSTDTALCIAQ